VLIIPLLWLVLFIVGGVSATILLKVVRYPILLSKIGPIHPLIGGR
jgi:tryptophan-rich sensory protein